MTLVTIGGAEKTACLTGETLITEADGRQVRYGQLSWVLGQALLRRAPGSPWGEILQEMTQLIRQQSLVLAVSFHGQITEPVGV
jgi:hypothetical protein